MVVQFIRSNLELFIIGSLGLQVLLLIMVCWGMIRMSGISTRFKVLLKGNGKVNLEDTLVQALDQSRENQVTLGKLVEQQLEIRTTLARCIQHRAVNRFNAFDNLGGEQSFAVVLVDDKGDGVVISSLYGRDESRSYAKPIIGGKSKYALSDEETQAISDALIKNSR